MSEFKSFPKIERFKGLQCTITQKINGTNAQILIEPNQIHTDMLSIQAGSRNRWLTLGHDNYGFCQWVDNNKADLIRILGPGRHYGEWAGPGIQNGEGLSEKTFVSFEHWKSEAPNPTNIAIKYVPLLYRGPYTDSIIDEIKTELLQNGSRLSPGFMQPEGFIIQFNATNYKIVFEQEASAWKPKKEVRDKISFDISTIEHLLQPIRMQKIKSSDEQLSIEYPQSLGTIVKLYLADLESEGYTLVDHKQLSRAVFQLAKEVFNEEA